MGVESWKERSQDAGSFTAAYQLDGISGMYTLTASDGTSTATATFTDATGIFSVAPSGSIWTGTAKTSFSSTDDVYAYIKTNGSNAPYPNVNIYIVTTVPANNHSLTDVSVQSIADITISADTTLEVWHHFTTAGTYYLVVDEDRDGVMEGSNKSSVGFTIVLVKITPTLSVTNSPVTYNGSLQSATVTGSVSGTVSDVKYGGSSTAPINAGTYAVTADFVPDDTTNYNSLNDASAGNFVITKVNAVITVTGFSGSYDGNAHGVISSSAVGVESTPADLSGLLSVAATTYINVPGGLVHWTFTGDTNYNATSGDATVTITKADPTVSVTWTGWTYDGTAHAASGFAYGVGGVGDVLIPAVTFSYLSNPVGTYGPSSSAPSDAGTYRVTASFAGNSNYNSASNTADVTVDKATMSILYTGVQLMKVSEPLAPITAKLSGAGALATDGTIVYFYLDLDPRTGAPVAAPGFLLAQGTSNAAGIVTASDMPGKPTLGWLSGVYEVTAAIVDPNVNYCSDEATLTIAGPGDAATGGGWYTVPGTGRVNFGFTVKLVEGTLNTYKGQILLINNGKWRLKGTLNSYGCVGVQGAASGTGNLYRWDSTANGGQGAWVLSEAGVSFTISFADNNAGGGTGNNKKTIAPDTFCIHINHVIIAGEPGPLPNSTAISLKGGNIDIKKK